VRFFETPGLDFEQRFQDALVLAVVASLMAVEQRKRALDSDNALKASATVWAVSSCVAALRDEICLPASVARPRVLAPLARADAILRAEEDMAC